MDGFEPSIFMLKNILIQSKKDSLSSKSVFLGEGIFTMGLVKTIYNVLGGFYVLYNSTIFTESVHKLYEILSEFSYIFDKRFTYMTK